MYNGLTKKVLKHLDFLVKDYNFQFSFQTFERWHNFLGPMDAYSFYNEFGCLTLHNAVQRGEWGVFVAKKFSTDQYALMKQEVCLANYTTKSCWTTTGLLKILSQVIKTEIVEKQSIFDIPIKK